MSYALPPRMPLFNEKSALYSTRGVGKYGKNELNQWTITNTTLDLDLMTWIEAFLVDRKAQNLSRGTLYFYQAKLKLFSNYCEGQVVGRVTGITPDVIRRYLLFLEENGHNPADTCRFSFPQNVPALV